jgi:L-lysine 6-transaminase
LNRGCELLDLFGLYSSLPLGYNHPIFAEPKFKNAIAEAAAVKIPNNEMATVPADAFLEAFSGHASMAPFAFFHFTCTGALAIEAALKTACDYRQSKNPKVITFQESFHGINGVGGWVTSRFGTVRDRLDGFPGPFSLQLENPVVRYQNGKRVVDAVLRNRVLTQVRDLLKSDRARDVVGVLVEPIQCTAGDQMMDREFLQDLRRLCTDYDTPLIFDEVQTGFGVTGTLWYFEQCGFVPDIVAFGKKTQTSGIMVRQPFGRIFDRPVRLEVTWDGDVLDMIRCHAILDAYQKYGILKNVEARGAQLAEGLRAIRELKNVRQVGLLIAFDFENTAERSAYVQGMLERKAIVSPTQQITVRWRPNLALTAEDGALALAKTADVFAKAYS